MSSAATSSPFATIANDIDDRNVHGHFTQAQMNKMLFDLEKLDVEHLRTKLQVLLRVSSAVHDCQQVRGGSTTDAKLLGVIERAQDGNMRMRQEKIQQEANLKLRLEAEEKAILGFGTDYRTMVRQRQGVSHAFPLRQRFTYVRFARLFRFCGEFAGFTKSKM